MIERCPEPKTLSICLLTRFSGRVDACARCLIGCSYPVAPGVCSETKKSMIDVLDHPKKTGRYRAPLASFVLQRSRVGRSPIPPTGATLKSEKRGADRMGRDPASPDLKRPYSGRSSPSVLRQKADRARAGDIARREQHSPRCAASTKRPFAEPTTLAPRPRCPAQ